MNVCKCVVQTLIYIGDFHWVQTWVIRGSVFTGVAYVPRGYLQYELFSHQTAHDSKMLVWASFLNAKHMLHVFPCVLST